MRHVLALLILIAASGCDTTTTPGTDAGPVPSDAAMQADALTPDAGPVPVCMAEDPTCTGDCEMVPRCPCGYTAACGTPASVWALDCVDGSCSCTSPTHASLSCTRAGAFAQCSPGTSPVCVPDLEVATDGGVIACPSTPASGC